MVIALARIADSSDGARVLATRLDEAGEPLVTEYVTDLPAFVAAEETQHPRWVWDDTARWYPELLAARVRVERCVDLRLCHAILRHSSLTAGSALARAEPNDWDGPAVTTTRADDSGALFDLEPAANTVVEADPLAEFALQRLAVAASAEPGRIGRLLAAESAGALIAAEMRFAGLPWRADRHDEIL
ncbi:MAG: bifunctional 3'-5' exonuclease/DNA polymerase, partial [Rhodoglobus sp.]